MSNGLFNVSVWQLILVIVLFTQMTIAAVTLYLHRCQTHRAIDLHPIVRHWFRFWLWLTTGMITKEWVAIHRKHHAYTEQAHDPHSPQIYGIKKVLFDGISLYRSACRDQTIVAQYGHGTPDDFMEKYLYTRHPYLGITLMAIIDVLLFGVIGLTVWAVQMFWIPFFAAGVINGLGHYFGYRNYDCPDASRNILPLGLFIGGEELHNNHHCCASSAKFSMKWWEFDLGWCYIAILRWCRLAKVNKLPPRVIVNPEKQKVDLETLAAVMATRLPLLAAFTREVVRPVFRQEKRLLQEQSKKITRQVKRAWHRGLVGRNTPAKTNYVTYAFEAYQALNIAYQYRDQLIALWSHRQQSPQALLAALQEWIQQAERCPVEKLQAFAKKMRCLVLVPSLTTN